MSLTTNQPTYKIAYFIAQSFVEKLVRVITLLFKRFLTFHYTRRFITLFKRVHDCSLSWGTSICFALRFFRI